MSDAVAQTASRPLGVAPVLLIGLASFGGPLALGGLSLVYTSASVVHDLLPVAVPSTTGAGPWLAVALPLAIAALLLAGRAQSLPASG